MNIFYHLSQLCSAGEYFQILFVLIFYKWREVIVTGEDEMAKCFCHELEHLDGEIFLDKAFEEVNYKSTISDQGDASLAIPLKTPSKSYKNTSRRR